MTTRELHRLTNKWCERLRLLDWDLDVRFATAKESSESWGLCMPEHTTKEATIVLHNPNRPSGEIHGKYVPDPETTLVHELFHLHFAALNHKEGSPQEAIEEHIVAITANLLVAMDRRDETLINPMAPRKLSRVASFSK